MPSERCKDSELFVSGCVRMVLCITGKGFQCLIGILRLVRLLSHLGGQEVDLNSPDIISCEYDTSDISTYLDKLR